LKALQTRVFLAPLEVIRTIRWPAPSAIPSGSGH
jgi:hypothetical protein